jgi:drug/metabolite transporter (DMT)-like permease
MNRHAILYAILSAALFGISTPAAKVLLGSTNPEILAGLLYSGAGVGIAVLRRLAGSILAPPNAWEVSLGRADMPWLAGAIVAGGIVGPVLLLLGLTRTDAAAASLLLTLEGVATAFMAWFLFQENFDRRIALGMGFLVAGAAVLSWSGQTTVSNVAGPLAIIGACIAWGLDNNLTRKISLSDPLQIVELKGLVAGPVNIVLGLWIGGELPGVSPIIGATIVGFIGYGVTLALFVVALRHLGTARTAAYFSTAPVFGATASILALGESPNEPHTHWHEHDRLGVGRSAG